MITYAQLKEELSKLNDEQLNSTATVYFSDDEEFIGVSHLDFTNVEENDVLDDNHPIMVVSF